MIACAVVIAVALSVMIVNDRPHHHRSSEFIVSLHGGEAAAGLHDWVVGTLGCHWAGEPVARDGAVKDTRINLSHVRLAEAQLLHGLVAHVVQHNVRLSRQPHEQPNSPRPCGVFMPMITERLLRFTVANIPLGAPAPSRRTGGSILMTFAPWWSASVTAACVLGSRRGHRQGYRLGALSAGSVSQ